MRSGSGRGRVIRAIGVVSFLVCASAFCALLLASCERAKGPEVVLYTSCDDYLLREIKPLFEKETGIKLLIVGDTEATKTTGLVQRVIAEKDRPRADVWWSNEALGTLKLAEEGLLAPSTPRALKEDFGGKWPAGLSSPDGLWWGFALRARVMVWAFRDSTISTMPQSLEYLTYPHWKGRVGMARPQFGTTRGHMAWLLASSGEEAFRAWLTGLRQNGGVTPAPPRCGRGRLRPARARRRGRPGSPSAATPCWPRGSPSTRWGCGCTRRWRGG